ncbi:CvpA family protein [Hutsoniella sourekii]|uniref:CvpA family protein n=1 Tax=Hutsoniella sourekii TaxID=87650 RepID=UPI0004856A16|nr:CvpA family protein [Hutsoniella sourekii]
MLTILILIGLALAFYQGYRRGLALQVIRLVGYGVSFTLAGRFYEPLSKIVEMLVPFPALQPSSQLAIYDEALSFQLDQVFYRVLTFALISAIGFVVTNILSLFFNRLSYYEFYHRVNAIGGGVINVFIAYVIVFLVLFILSLIPIEFIQQQFVDNPLAYRIVSSTPILSDWASQLWVP